MSVTLVQVEGFRLETIERFQSGTDAVRYAIEYWHESAGNAVAYQPCHVRDDDTGEIVSTLLSMSHDRTKVMVIDSTGYIERWSVWPIEDVETNECVTMSDIDEAWLA